MAFNLNANITILEFVTLKDKVFLARQLATMLGTGIPIDQCFRIINLQEKKQVLRKAYAEILAELQQGQSLSHAISSHKNIFDPVFVAVVRSGETTGQLDKVLVQLAERMEINQEFQSKLRSAMIYPLFVVFTMFVIVWLMMIYVVPQLTTVFKETGAELPLATRIVVWLSDFSVQYWWVELIIFALIGVGIYFFMRQGKGGSAWDQVKVRIPGLKSLYVMVYMARFCRTLSILTQSGVPIIETLAVTADVIQNRRYTDSLRKAAAQIERGVPMSVPLEKDPNFPIIVSQMIIVGEQTGKVEMVLDKLAEYYERETDAMIKGISGLIEPILIVIVGTGVGFLIYSIIFPIYDLARINF